jgi:hypothetical protein
MRCLLVDVADTCIVGKFVVRLCKQNRGLLDVDLFLDKFFNVKGLAAWLLKCLSDDELQLIRDDGSVNSKYLFVDGKCDQMVLEQTKESAPSDSKTDSASPIASSSSAAMDTTETEHSEPAQSIEETKAEPKAASGKPSGSKRASKASTTSAPSGSSRGSKASAKPTTPAEPKQTPLQVRTRQLIRNSARAAANASDE